MTSEAQTPVPPDPKRQAAHIVSAFRFQLMETAIAWLSLPEEASLLIEIFEDFDIEAQDGATELTQIKHSVSNRTITLASKAAQEALENYWATSRSGEVTTVSLVVHTNMPIGSEQGVILPDNATGIDYWRSVQSGADLAPLKALLVSKLPDGALKTWLASDPPDASVCTRLIDRVFWKTSQPSGPAQNAHLIELLAGRLAALKLPVGLAPRIAGAIVERIGEVASETDCRLRRLTLTDLHTLLNEICRPGQPGHESGWSRASWTASVDEIDLPSFQAARDLLVDDLSQTLSETCAVWLHGASGTGKSTLAQQVARAGDKSWLVIEFRDQNTSNGVLLRLDRTYTDVVLGGTIGGVTGTGFMPASLFRSVLQRRSAGPVRRGASGSTSGLQICSPPPDPFRSRGRLHRDTSPKISRCSGHRSCRRLVQSRFLAGCILPIPVSVNCSARRRSGGRNIWNPPMAGTSHISTVPSTRDVFAF